MCGGQRLLWTPSLPGAWPKSCRCMELPLLSPCIFLPYRSEDSPRHHVMHADVIRPNIVHALPAAFAESPEALWRLGPQLTCMCICPDCLGCLCSCVPGIATKEAGLILAQGLLLLSRTWLTDYISRIEARAGRHLISQVRLCGISGTADVQASLPFWMFRAAQR